MARALLSQSRGHRFKPCTAYHLISSLCDVEWRRTIFNKKLPANFQVVCLWFVIALIFSVPVFSKTAKTPTPSQTPLSPEQLWEQMLLNGLDETYNMHYAAAAAIFDKAIATHPERMEGYFGHLIINWEKLKDDKEDKSVEDALVKKGNELISLGKAYENNRHHDAYSLFFTGNAYGCLALLSMWDGDYLDAFNKSSEAISRLKKSLEQEPDLIDANVGLGIYQYYIDTLPIIPRLFGSWLLINGSKTEGIKKLELVCEKGHYAKVMAKVFIAEGLGIYEDQYAKSATLLKELVASYPDNFRYRLNLALVTSFFDPDAGATLFNEILQMMDDKHPTFNKKMAPFIHIMLGNLYRAKKEYEQAIREYELCNNDAKAMPRFLVWGNVEEGRTYDIMGKDDEATKAYKKSLTYPDFDGAHAEARVRMRSSFNQGDVADANKDTVYRLLSLPKK